MAKTCGCHGQPAVAHVHPINKPAGAPVAESAANQTVGDIAARSPRHREILQSFGIDQCCSAGLTLTEATAAAGVDVQMLLRALSEAV